MKNNSTYKEIRANSVEYKINSNNHLKIGYFADGKWGVNSFKKFLRDKSLEVKFVVLRYNNPDKNIEKIAKENKIPCFVEKNINDSSFLKKISSFNCDIFVSMSFNQIFKTEIINIPKFKIINCHAGKLPFYRGRNVLNWVLINDEKEFGITVHYVDEGIDTGDILMQRIFPINDTDNYNTLLQKAYVECANILYDTLKLMQNSKKIEPITQNSIHPIGFYCSQRKVGDENINWNQISREVFNFVRAISKPGPMARSFINGKEIKINKVELIPKAPNYKDIVGSVVGIEKDGFLVKTKDNFVKVVEYEYEGKITIGDRLK